MVKSKPKSIVVGVAGGTGAGKSTILNLIPRFYDAKSGDIKIDKQSIYNSSLYSLGRNISLVSQDRTLFDDTIFNNIQYANKDASLDEVIKSAEYSFASEFIEKLPSKYDTLIGENGVRLSRGEKQRLSIARAMLKKSKILLLDDCLSSVDIDTEKKILSKMKFKDYWIIKFIKELSLKLLNLKYSTSQRIIIKITK